MASNIVQYGGFSVEDAQEVAEEAAKGAVGGWLTLADGRNVLRVLPARLGGKAIVTIPQHWVKLPGQEKGASINCAQLMMRKPCIICDYQARLMASGNAADYKIAKDLTARRQNFCAVIQRKDEGRGPLLMRFGKTILDDLIDMRADEINGGDFTDPVNGFDVIVKRKGSGLETEYKTTKGATCPLHDDAEVMNMWLEKLPNLDLLRAIPSEEDILEQCGDSLLAVARPRGIHGASHAVAARRRPEPATRRAVSRSVEDDIIEVEGTVVD